MAYTKRALLGMQAQLKIGYSKSCLVFLSWLNMAHLDPAFVLKGHGKGIKSGQ